MEMKQETDKVNGLLNLIRSTDIMIDRCKQHDDQFGVRQYEFQKARFLKELLEILQTEYKIPFQLKASNLSNLSVAEAA